MISVHHPQHARWPTAVSVVLALAAHAAVLALATSAVLPGGRSVDLVRVSLRSGGGATAAPGDVSAMQPVASHAQSPAPQLQLVPPPRRQPVRRQSQARQDQPRNSPPAAAPAAPPSVTTEAAVLSVRDDGPAGYEETASGAGGGSGVAGRSGSGVGQGPGTSAGGEHDQRASCVYCPRPPYPLLARARGWQGSVDVGLLVLADGSVDTASVRRSSGYGVLDEAAMTVARCSRFTPPAASGLLAPLRGRIEYRFELTASR
jgi:protein TonB